MDELDALWAFLVAGGVSFLLTPLAAGLARRLGVVHLPRQRDLHDRPTPGLGGLAILVAVVVSAVGFLPDEQALRGLAILVAVVVSAMAFLPNDQETRGSIFGAIAIPLIGAADDMRPNGL